jgi:uncharacterized protein YkwD
VRRLAAVVGFIVAVACSAPASRNRTREAAGKATETPQADIVTELNLARANPAAYTAKLEARRAYYRGKVFHAPNQIPIQTNEGVAAVDETICALRATPARPSVAESRGLRDAALEHVRDIGPKGAISHEGTDHSSPFDRVRRRDPQAMTVAEVMSFGSTTAESVLVDLLIDDGVPDRGHRRILLDPKYRFAGSACGPHKTYRVVCVIDLADSAK